MFGIGKIIGSVFERLGLEWLGQAVQLAINLSTGNWLAVAEQVFELVARFSQSGWMQRVAQVQPLGLIGEGVGSWRALSAGRVIELSERLGARSERVSAALRLASEFVALSAEAMRQRQMAQLAQAV